MRNEKEKKAKISGAGDSCSSFIRDMRLSSYHRFEINVYFTGRLEFV